MKIYIAIILSSLFFLLACVPESSVEIVKEGSLGMPVDELEEKEPQIDEPDEIKEAPEEVEEPFEGEIKEELEGDVIEEEAVETIGCGDGRCIADEAECSEEAHRTKCFEDCGSRCEAFVVMTDDAESSENKLLSFSCVDENCEKIDTLNKYKVKTKSKLITYLNNLGEMQTGNVYSRTKCDFYENGMLVSSKKGVKVKSYFGDKEEYSKGVPPVFKEVNYETFAIEVDASSLTLKTPFDLICRINLDSTDGSIDIDQPLEVEVNP